MKYKNKLKSNIFYTIENIARKQRWREPGKAIIVNGASRSGTTWMTEILSDILNRPKYLEPLESYRLNVQDDYNFIKNHGSYNLNKREAYSQDRTIAKIYREPILQNENNYEAKEYFEDVLKGKLIRP